MSIDIIEYQDEFGSLVMPRVCVQECSASGDVTAIVEAWIDDPRVDWSGTDADSIRNYLKGFGAWNEQELANDRDNRSRVLWVSAGNIMDKEFDNDD